MLEIILIQKLAISRSKKKKNVYLPYNATLISLRKTPQDRE